MIAAATPDYLPFRLVNVTGRDVVVRRKNFADVRLPVAGSILWRNESQPKTTTFYGLPLVDYRMSLFGGLPPLDPEVRVGDPVYFLVDPFSAMALLANRAYRPDVLVMAEYEPHEDHFVVTALGTLPLE